LTTNHKPRHHRDADADEPEVVPSHWRNGGPITLASDTLAPAPGGSTPADFVSRVREIAAGDLWVFDSWGQEEVRDRMWDRADTIEWLDYPGGVVIPRLIRRSLRRSVRRERIFGGNVETWSSWLSVITRFPTP